MGVSQVRPTFQVLASPAVEYRAWRPAISSVDLAPEIVVEQRDAEFHEHFVHMVGAAAVVVVARIVGAERPQVVRPQSTKGSVQGSLTVGGVEAVTPAA